MAQALNPAHLAAAAAQVKAGTSSQEVLLASCKSTVYQLRNKLWEPMYDGSLLRLQLHRKGAENYTLLAVDEQIWMIKLKVVLRYNSVFKVIRSNFFVLLNNGTTFWGFEVAGQAGEAQTFSIVMQNSLASLQEPQRKQNSKPVAPAAQQTLQTSARKDLKDDQQFYLSNICLTLSDAINRGNEQIASDLARHLASQKALVRIKLAEAEDDDLSKGVKDNKISVRVQVEDKESAGCQFRLDITPQTTINQLKKMVQVKYQFPAEVQRWIIGKRLPKPCDSLLDCGIKTSGSTLFLYLVSARSSPAERPGMHRSSSDTSIANVSDAHQVSANEDNVFECLPRARLGLQSMPNLASEPRREPVVVIPEGWYCPDCTYRNAPTRPGCEMCAANRPADYQIPEGYLPTEREIARMELERSGELMVRQEEERRRQLEMEERDRNLQRLLSVVDQPLVLSQDEFQCPICFDDIAAGDGVVLRECLHNFCRDCLTEHIRASTEPAVQCPFDNGEFACHDIITPQEIQQLLNEEDFQKYLQRSLVTAESQAPNSFHCQTPNCQGWCIYDDEVNEFDCPVCGKRNCLTCKAIHHPINCKEYQDDLRRNAANDEAARKTQEYLEEMLRRRDAMYCPGCKIVLVKKDGCDWMKCSVCRTEICWAVRGPRWGPGGPGDTSGGCKCMVNRRKCDPNCRNCH